MASLRFGLVAIAGILLGCGAAFAQQRPLGTDVSGYQPSINWTTVKNAGVVFAWTKATEWTGYVNPYFTAQESGAKGVGIYIGAYHFARPSSNPNITGANSADSEAAYFWSTAGNYVTNGGTYLVPMLDWEDTGATVAAGFTAATMSAWVNEWCTTVSNYARAKGIIVKPVVYTGTWYSVPGSTYPGLNSTVTGWPSWIAAYPTNPNAQTGAPSSSSPWSTWNLWQYADTNWSGGDADVFNGTLSGFIQSFVVGGTNIPSFTTSPANVTVVPGASATFSVTASGQAPLSFRWYFDGTPIPGATSSNYTIASVQLANAGGYSVVVSNSYATVPSITAFLSVIAPLTNGNGAAVAPTGLVDWWPGEGNIRDIFGSYNGTPKNGFSYVTGKEGLAFHFDGSTSYVTTGAPTLAAPWTACMWVNRQNAPGTAAALMSDGTYSLKLEQYKNTRKVGVTQLSVGDYAFNYTAPAGVWTHLAFVNNGSQTLLYANGAYIGATNAIPLPRAYIGATYVASGGYIVDYMLGGVDEIMCFNRALSATEIAAIYNAGSTGFVRAPEFTGMTPVSASQFQLNLAGVTAKTITIYKSLDLETWAKLSTISNPSGSIQFTDNGATNGIGFYRLTQP
jgi:GH25 family lysozyme M1 (1,4-beta-N-acetylmuramidase)